MPFKGIFPKLHPIKELKQSRVMEIAPDVWEIEGYISTNFFIKPASSNIFIFRDGESVILLDTGLYPYYRKLILEILEKFKQRGAKNLILLVSQGHFDHVGNNDIILEANYTNTKFLLPEVELGTINLLNHFFSDFEELEKFYNPYSVLPILMKIINKLSYNASKAIFKKIINLLFREIITMADKAEILSTESRVKRKIGDVEFMGWDIGRFYAIHDGAHSPGHISLYDPKYKLLMTGDATIEINPPFFNSRLLKCIEITEKFYKITKQGYVQMVVDSHHSSTNFKRLLKMFKLNPLDPIQLADMVNGKIECEAFFNLYKNFYNDLKDEVLLSLSRLRRATISEIVKEFKKSKNKSVQFKIALDFPRLPSRLDVLVAVLIDELKINYEKEGNKVFFIANNK